MVKTRLKKFKKIIAVIFAALLHFSSMWNVGAAQAGADVSRTPENYESQSVLDDLAGMTIDGKDFSLADFPKNTKDSPRILTFVEYCYAYNADMRGYYGLYIYLYNPQQIAFECVNGKNKLEMLAGDMQNYQKYDLQLLSVTTQAGYESRFYKFKVVFTETQRAEVLQALNAEIRVYNISGIELLDPNWVNYPNAHDYPVGGTDSNGNPLGMTYTYTGYAAGYGEKGTSEATLNCKVDGLETVSLEVKHTTYRPTGTAYSEGYKQYVVRDSLSSVYFAVPKNLRNYYDDLQAVHATWLEAETAPMLVTGNKDVYDNFFNFIGDKIYYGASDSYCPIYKVQNTTHTAWGEVAPWVEPDLFGHIIPTISYAMGNHSAAIQETGENIPNGLSYSITGQDRYVEQLNWLFYARGGIDVADRYCVSSEELYNWAYNTFAEITKGTGIDYGKQVEQDNALKEELENPSYDPWSPVVPSNPILAPNYPIMYFEQAELKNGNGLYLPLLDRLADSYREETITSDTEYSITSNEWVVKNWWWIISWYEQQIGDSTNVRAIYEVTDEDFKSNDKKTICERLLISELDYENFKQYFEENKASNRIYLFRFDKSEFISTELVELTKGTSTIDTNAYFCKEKIYLDFDIIDITVTKNGEEFVIGCVMSPLDIFPSTTPPPLTTSDMPEWWIPALITEIVLIVSFIGVVLIKRFIREKFRK